MNAHATKLPGALWADASQRRDGSSLGWALAIGIVIEIAAIALIGRIDFSHHEAPPPREVMKVVTLAPEPPKPPEPPKLKPPEPKPVQPVRKVAPTPPKPQPKVADVPRPPEPAPPADIPVAQAPSATAPAVGSEGASGPAVAGPVSAPAAPAAPVHSDKPSYAEVGIVCPTQVKPEVPVKAAREGISGVVQVLITVEADGRIGNVDILSAKPPRVFNSAVISAVKQYRCHGTGQQVLAKQEFAFNLN